MNTLLSPGCIMRHSGFGKGVVEMVAPPSAVVRFEEGLKMVPLAELMPVRDVFSALASGSTDDATGALARVQALAITALNAEWGIFSRSRIELLPHQLWVCRKVTETWPFHWLVADDVGLGKTIECGLVLAPLMATGTVRRALILCPASLQEQWRERMLDMFDLRFTIYESARVKERANPFQTAHCLIASAQTVRDERHALRLLEADPWDIVVVDEAHHANAEDHAKRTKLFQLLQDMREAESAESMLYFTGTPHRGKDFGFFALLSLLRPDLFDPYEPTENQLPALREVMIRNNKSSATDLSGAPIFTPVTTKEHLFEYSDDEALFYSTMSAFIEDGLAYANDEGGTQGSARKLVVTALQKLAASSGAAIGSALRKRRMMLDARHEERRKLHDDEAGDAEMATGTIMVVEGEAARLDILIGLHEAIETDSKIMALVALLEQMPENEPVLLFTEYIATQRAAIEALEARFGIRTTGFINGDGRIEDIRIGNAPGETRLSDRADAADMFNEGSLRFLVSTEAAGEGIDLQKRCATLVHVDLPWNPMRLHQRVGRLSRFGQTRPVSVHLLRNPDTVDGRIHDLLREKIARIQRAFDVSMHEREDMALLVLGMAGDAFYEALYVEAPKADDRLDSWFDARTRSFGGRSAVETARAIFGSVDRFDFGRDGGATPAVELDVLESFVGRALAVQGRRLLRNTDGTVSFRSPEVWRTARMRPRYENLRFDRLAEPAQILASGHPAFDRLIADAQGSDHCLAVVSGISVPMLVVIATDPHDSPRIRRREQVVGVALTAEGPSISDTKFLLYLVATMEPREVRDSNSLSRSDIEEALSKIAADTCSPVFGKRLRVALCLLPEARNV